ncbi:hypothetical protein PENTCL1PPCAC_30464, partial [Pristionchus entomophagus]
KKGLYQTCDSPTQTSVRVSIETHEVDSAAIDVVSEQFENESYPSHNEHLFKNILFQFPNLPEVENAFINYFCSVNSRLDKILFQLQFVGCFTDGKPANLAEKNRSRNIAQCDFTKLNKDAEMIIV